MCCNSDSGASNGVIVPLEESPLGLKGHKKSVSRELREKLKKVNELRPNVSLKYCIIPRKANMWHYTRIYKNQLYRHVEIVREIASGHSIVAGG